MKGPPYRYHPHVLEALEHHGLRPKPTTDPRHAYELLKAIYSFEIREMKFRRWEKQRLLGPQPLADYRRELHELQERYPILKVPPQHWVEGDGAG